MHDIASPFIKSSYRKRFSIYIIRLMWGSFNLRNLYDLQLLAKEIFQFKIGFEKEIWAFLWTVSLYDEMKYPYDSLKKYYFVCG